ncbi:MAG: hypothetical protein JW757_04290 [Anaerolineales bacterium]|nr:hypothetical protein [Anaerolineales bacterium]
MRNLFDLWNKIKTSFNLDRWDGWWAGLRLSPGWVSGPAVTVGLLVLILAGYYGVDAHSGYGLLVDLVIPAALAALAYLLALALGSWLLRMLLRLPLILWAAVIAGVVIGLQVWGDRTWLHWLFNLGLVLGAVLVGIGVPGILREWGSAPLRKQIMLGLFTAIGVGILAVEGYYIFSPGSEAAKLPVEIKLGKPQISGPDPSLPGAYPVGYLTYGSGTDRQREEFAADVDLVTETVDASPYVTYSDWNGRLRKFFFGFDESAFPLNGRVWYPQGMGPFPLVLIVHGNHNLADFSDPGYAYLGELLASRGFIVVSVDQNFLNGGIPGKSSGENDARAWMLLEHLAVWEGWHLDPESPFYQQVDLEKIALIGHSRGGEAAALAATFNQLSRYPNNAHIRWEYDYGIKAVVAIAPVDQQWLPADHPNPLVDTSYLVLQGSHDADLYYFDGIGQYQRTSFADSESGAFKSAVYLYRANHSQFNTTWGAQDYPGVRGVFLNRRALLTSEEQQQAAKVLISGFLESVLHDQMIYREMYEDYRAAGNWLPQTGYITRYEDYGVKLVADFEDDLDPVTLSYPGARAVAAGLSTWSERAPRFRSGNRQDNHAAYLGWRSLEGYYAIELPPSFDWPLSPKSKLVFLVADGRSGDEVDHGLDFSVVLTDLHGERAVIRLSQILPLQTQFPAEISRIALWNEEYYENESEPVFQGYRIPLQDFLEENPSLSLTGIKQIRFVFDDPVDGKIYLDEIGFDLD